MTGRNDSYSSMYAQAGVQMNAQTGMRKRMPVWAFWVFALLLSAVNTANCEWGRTAEELGLWGKIET